MKLFNWFKKRNTSTWSMDTELLTMLEFYKASFELAQDAKLVLDGTKIIKFNLKALELFGAEDSEQIGHHSFCEFLHSDCANIIPALSDQLKGRQCKAKIKTLTGKLLDVTITFNVLIVNAKSLTFVTIRDITETLEVQEALKVFISVLDTANQGIIITDTDANILWSNKTLTEMTGYSVQEIVGKTPKIFKSNRTPFKVYENLWNTITAGQVWEGMLVNKKKNNEEYIESMHIVPVKVAGVIRYYIAFKEILYKKESIA